MLLWIVWLYFILNICYCNSLTEVPNPQVEFHTCGRQKPSYICDPEFVLDLGDADKLDQLSHELKSQTSCICSTCSEERGIEIGIFIGYNFPGEISSQDSVHKLAEKIRQQWKLGTCDDDIILILFIQSNVTGFSLGSSVQQLLSEEKATQIVEDCKVHFYFGYYYQGLESIINSFNDVIVREQSKDPDSKKDNSLLFGLSIGFAALFAILACVLAVRFRQVKRRKKSCSNIYENGSIKRDLKGYESENTEQLEKLNQRSDIGDEENI